MSPHILFVDDEVPVRETLAMFFKMKGIPVTAVGTGAEALQLVETKRFDLIILDLRLASENGLDVLDRLKQKHPSVPVVMFTAFGDDDERMNQATARGASGWFCKGESITNLFNGVQRILKESSSSRVPAASS